MGSYKFLYININIQEEPTKYTPPPIHLKRYFKLMIKNKNNGLIPQAKTVLK